MWNWCIVYFLVFLTSFGLSQDVSEEATTEAQLKEGERRMSEYILQILEHYKQPDPVGIPGADIPEPFPVPDTKKALAVGTLYFKNTAVYGLRDFKIISVNLEIGSMEVRAAMLIEKLRARGNYTMSTWVSRVQGPFTVDVTGLKMTARGTLGVERDGKVRAQDIQIDLKPDDIKVDFQNLGLMATVLQGFINTAGTVIFDSVKPLILQEAYTKARDEVNKQLEEVAGDMQFPNSISPLDMVIVDARKKVRLMNLDPYKIKDYNNSISIFSIALSHTWITGASSIHRVGNITLKMENNTVIADFEIGTQKLEGTTMWDISALGGLMSRGGTASFSVEYISARLVVAQPMDTRERPHFEDLQLEVGNIQVRCDGAGTMDYAIEFVVNVLPNLLRYQIMDAIEEPLKEWVQLELNRINVEELIKQKLPEVDEMQKKGFKLSSLIENTVEEVPPEEVDEFFDF